MHFYHIFTDLVHDWGKILRKKKFLEGPEVKSVDNFSKVMKIDNADLVPFRVVVALHLQHTQTLLFTGQCSKLIICLNKKYVILFFSFVFCVSLKVSVGLSLLLLYCLLYMYVHYYFIFFSLHKKKWTGKFLCVFVLFLIICCHCRRDGTKHKITFR